jgi:hypothetical protein
MLRLVSTALAVAFLTAGAFAEEKKRAAIDPVAGENATPVRASLRGVWRVTEFSSRPLGGQWAAATPYVSLYIFTEKHYSYMFAPGVGPRRIFAGDPNKPTDVEKAGAYDSFVAASGTYVLSGSALTLTALIHKNPNEMTGERLNYTIEIDGNTLRMTIVSPPFAPGRERRTVLTRIE